MKRRDSSQEAVNQRIDAVINNPCVPALVSAYYDQEGPFAGIIFDSVGTDGKNPDRFTESDLLAVTLLDVVIKAPVVRRLLADEPEAADDFRADLHEVRADLDIWNAADADFDAAERVWQRLRKYPGIDWVTAGKLLARKRPRLIPVIDSVIVEAVGAPGAGYWEAYRSALGDSDRLSRVRYLRPAGLDSTVSDLRVLDTALWMRHSHGRNAIAARESAGCT